MIEEIAGLFAGPGAAVYLGEPVTIGLHMRQAAALAKRAGAADALVAAALLHDVGHLLGAAGREHGAAGHEHGAAGASWLARWFGPEVTEPVRLHVPAKRYLCATEPGYASLLSEESARTLAAQGGPMTPDAAAAFRAHPHAAAALAVRRWDEAAKDPAGVPPPFGQFITLLDRLAGRPAGRPPHAPGGGTAR